MFPMNCHPEQSTCLWQVKDGMNENGDCLLGPAPQQHCHPDRSEAKWRDLLCAFTPNEGPTSELANPAQAVCSSRPERTRISCHTALERAACAALRKESRMRFVNATKLNRKSGGAQWRGPACFLSSSADLSWVDRRTVCAVFVCC